MQRQAGSLSYISFRGRKPAGLRTVACAVSRCASLEALASTPGSRLKTRDSRLPTRDLGEDDFFEAAWGQVEFLESGLEVIEGVVDGVGLVDDVQLGARYDTPADQR